MPESNIRVSVTLHNIDPVQLKEERLALLQVVNENLNREVGDQLSGLQNFLDYIADEIYRQTGHQEQFYS